VGAVLVEGAPGIGKTALLEAVTSRACAAGSVVLGAAGPERETELTYGVVRQLFARILDDARGDLSLWQGAAGVARSVVDPTMVPATPGQLDRFAVWHGLYWLCASLAEREPLVVVVDDVQWADESSGAWLSYLARREPRSAVTYLERALDEPPGTSERGDMPFELGAAERELLSPHAEVHLRAALRHEVRPRRRAQIAAELMPILIQPGRSPRRRRSSRRSCRRRSDEAPAYQRRGALFSSVGIWTCGSGMALRMGRVRSAEADARHALDAMEGLQLIAPISMLIDALVEHVGRRAGSIA
jgi:hypothetical protein